MINNFHLWKPYKEVELEYTPLDPNLNIFLQDKVGWGISSVLVISIFHHQRSHKEIELEKNPSNPNFDILLERQVQSSLWNKQYDY